MIGLVIAAYTGTDDEQISACTGDVLEVLEVFDDGWCEAVLGDKEGIFPTAYLELQEEGVVEEQVIEVCIQ